MSKFLCIAALLAAPAAAAEPKKANHLAHSQTIATIPMVMMEQDCALNSPMNKALASKRKTALIQNPGAGLGEITPFEKVYKDGFYEVDCVKDSLREFGDKFGNGKQSYNMGDSANVSIIHYTEVVPKEDQEPMTHQVCFNFCRTVKDMGFFGIHNGRDCYCEPYFNAMESDSSDCDAVCEGSPGQMCGGKVKSSVFGMHSCMNKAEKLSDLSGAAETIRSDLESGLATIDEVAEDMQDSAVSWQKIAGNVGDPEASNLMQTAKGFAGELEKFSKDNAKKSEALKDAKLTAGALKGADLAKFETAAQADDAIAALKKAIAEGEDAAEATEEMVKLANEQDEDAEGKAKLYRGLMYFVDKEVEGPTTCNGEAVKKPMAGLSEDECAAACEANFQKCVAFSHYPAGDLCFMFSKLKTATVYTGCKAASFLQKAGKAETAPACKLRLSSYEGTSINPDSDTAKAGKCPNCLKELTKRDKCPSGP
jgi:hypothetical protein